MTNLDSLTKESVGRLLWRYSLPSIVGMLVMSLYNVIDRIILGQVVGADALSGLTITFPVMNLATAIGVLVGVGACTRVSIFLGAGNHREASQVLGNALVLTIVNGIIYISLFALFLDPLLRLFGASDVTIVYARDFMRWILPGLLLINIAFGFNNIMRSSGYPNKAMVTMILGAVCNIFLALLFVYKLRWGIKGAAIATDISMAITAAFVMQHFISRKSRLHFVRGIYRLKWDIVRQIISIGMAPSIINVAACLINILINKTLLANGGDIAIATAGIFVTFTSLVTCVVLGVNMGMQPIIGYNYGAGVYSRVRSTMLLAMVWGTAICTLGWIGGTFFPSEIASLFTVDQTLIEVTAEALPKAMSVFFVVGIQIIATGMLQSIGQAGKAIFLSLTRQVLFLIPLLLIMPRSMGTDGVWWSFPLSDILATVATIGLVAVQLRVLARRSVTPA